MLVSVQVVGVAMMMYDDIADDVITSSRRLLQTINSIFTYNGDNAIDFQSTYI